jgi:hypothetical protein
MPTNETPGRVGSADPEQNHNTLSIGKQRGGGIKARTLISRQVPSHAHARKRPTIAEVQRGMPRWP